MQFVCAKSVMTKYRVGFCCCCNVATLKNHPTLFDRGHQATLLLPESSGNMKSDGLNSGLLITMTEISY